MKAAAILFGAALALGGCRDDKKVVEETPKTDSAAKPIEAEQKPSEEGGKETKEALVRGTLSMKTGSYVITPCGGGEPRRLTDSTNGELARIWKGIAGNMDAELYAEIWVQGHQAMRVRRAAPKEIDGCTETWGDVQVRARGNEPFWLAEISPSEVRWKTPQGELELDDPQLEADEENRRVWRASDDGRKMEIVVTREPCADSMSGEILPLSARVTLDGTEYRGCANKSPED